MKISNLKKMILSALTIMVLLVPSFSYSACDKPLECYQEAVSLLQTARAEIQQTNQRVAAMETLTDQQRIQIEGLQRRCQVLQQELTAHKQAELFITPVHNGFNTPFQASTDGFVTVNGYSTSDGYLVVEGLVGSSQNNLQRVAAEMIGGEYWRDNGSFTFFVKKGSWWKVSTASGTSTLKPQSSILWIAFDHNK